MLTQRLFPSLRKLRLLQLLLSRPKLSLRSLFANVALLEASGNRILEGGEEAVLRVEVENKGEGTAKDVQILLSGNPMLVNYLGEKKSIGDIGAKEKDC